MVTNVTDKISELQERRRKLGADLRQHVSDTGENWTPEAQERLETIDAEYESVKAEIEEENAKAQRAALAAKTAEDDERTEFEYGTTEIRRNRAERERGPKVTSETRSLAFRAWAFPRTASREALEAARSVGLDVNSPQIGDPDNPDGGSIQGLMPYSGHDPLYHRRGNQDHIRRAVERRAQSVGTTTAGGHTVPEGMMQAIEIAMLKFGGMRQASTVVRTSDGRTIPWPTVDDTSNSGELLAENAAVSEQDVTVGQVTTSPYMYHSKLVKVSIQLLQDSATNWETLLGTLLGERLGRITNTHFTTGTGSSQPNGVVTASTAASVALAADNAPSYANLMSIKHSVDPAYRDMASWMFADTVLLNIKSIVDGDSRPLWREGLTSDAPDTIDGDPYVINQDVPTAATTGTKSLLYGDFSKYIIHDVIGMQFVRLNELYAANLQVGFHAYLRSDGDLLDAGVAPVKHATNP